MLKKIHDTITHKSDPPKIYNPGTPMTANIYNSIWNVYAQFSEIIYAAWAKFTGIILHSLTFWTHIYVFFSELNQLENNILETANRLFLLTTFMSYAKSPTCSTASYMPW